MEGGQAVSARIPDVMKMLDETPCKATPREELRNQIMSSIIPKNEREWWANRTIEQLERELNAANKRIKRLEEAGDEMYRWITVKRLCSIDCTEAWLKAKEAKL
jgi:hypothetical protein